MYKIIRKSLMQLCSLETPNKITIQLLYSQFLIPDGAHKNHSPVVNALGNQGI